MFDSIKEKLLGLLAPGADGPGSQEVAVTAFALAATDGCACRKMFLGEELSLACDASGVPAVTRRGKPVGGVPDAERPQVAKLLGQGARLSCRVVKLGEGGEVRVRISILL